MQLQTCSFRFISGELGAKSVLVIPSSSRSFFTYSDDEFTLYLFGHVLSLVGIIYFTVKQTSVIRNIFHSSLIRTQYAAQVNLLGHMLSNIAILHFKGLLCSNIKIENKNIHLCFEKNTLKYKQPVLISNFRVHMKI